MRAAPRFEKIIAKGIMARSGWMESVLLVSVCVLFVINCAGGDQDEDIPHNE